MTVLLRSALHRVNYWFDAKAGQGPKNHFEGNLRIENAPPAAFNCCKTLCLSSTRARCRGGLGLEDARRRPAAGVLDKIEENIPPP